MSTRRARRRIVAVCWPGLRLCYSHKGIGPRGSELSQDGEGPNRGSGRHERATRHAGGVDGGDPRLHPSHHLGGWVAPRATTCDASSGDAAAGCPNARSPDVTGHITDRLAATCRFRAVATAGAAARPARDATRTDLGPRHPRRSAAGRLRGVGSDADAGGGWHGRGSRPAGGRRGARSGGCFCRTFEFSAARRPPSNRRLAATLT